MSLLALLWLTLPADPAGAAAPQSPETVAASGTVVALCGDVTTPGTFLLREGGTVADLLAAGEASPTVESVHVVREAEQHLNVPLDTPLAAGDAVLVNPGFPNEPTRDVTFLIDGQPPLVVGLQPDEANVVWLRTRFGLGPADPPLQVAPHWLSDGRIHDGAAIVLPEKAAAHPSVQSLRTQQLVFDARAINVAVRVASAEGNARSPKIAPREPVAPNVSAVAASAAADDAAGNATPVQTASLPSPPPSAPPAMLANLPAAPGLAKTGPMTAASVRNPVIPPEEPNEAEPRLTSPTPFSTMLPTSTPKLSVGAFPAADPRDMEPTGGSYWNASPSPSPTTSSESSVATPSRPSIRQTAAVASSLTGGQMQPPRKLEQIAGGSPLVPATEPAESSTDAADASTPTAGKLGGVMFAAIVLVVCCGGLVLWSRGGAAPAAVERSIARAAADELPAVAAPITEQPSMPLAQTPLQGSVVGLDRLRVDAAHPISPPHYASNPAGSRPRSRQTVVAGQADSQIGDAAGGGSSTGSGPRFLAQPTPREPIATASAERPADLLARALQAMEREKRG